MRDGFAFGLFKVVYSLTPDLGVNIPVIAVRENFGFGFQV